MPDSSDQPWYRRLERTLRQGWKQILPARCGPKSRIARVITVPLPSPAPITAPFAVMVHAFYPDVVPEILTLLRPLQCSFQIFLTTDTEAKREEIEQYFSKESFARPHEIRVIPNRGRDIAPKWVGLADVYSRFEYFLHVHTKKSLFDPELGASWRRYLFESLIGSPEIVASNLQLLQNSRCGVVYPYYFRPVTLHGKWGSNFPATQAFLKQMDISAQRTEFDFPAGSMYWARTTALQPLLDRKLSYDDFLPEEGKIDGGLEHAVERSILFIANKAGYRGVPIIPRGHVAEGYRFVPLSQHNTKPKFVA